jgi:hypothetical protein
MTLVWRPGFQFDADASTYIESVEAADTQALETGVRYAINDFVIGCKQDGIWDAIKASCILAGARTLDGALVPLVGTAPTNYNFVAGDYNRETGLAGDGSTKFLNSNRNNNADPQNSFHVSVFPSTPGTAGYGIGAGADGNYTLLSTNTGAPANASRGSTDFLTSSNATSGISGHSRSSGSSVISRRNGTSTTFSNSSGTPANLILLVYARGTPAAPAILSNARLAFYSIGESLDLARLDARVTDLINAIGAAIP